MGIIEVQALGWSTSPVILELAGMGALFAAVARVPITATVVVFEMTSDFNILLPLMISSITAFLSLKSCRRGRCTIDYWYYKDSVLMNRMNLIHYSK